MHFKTSITNVQRDGTEIIRGHNLEELVKNNTFVETIYLLLKGEIPTKNQARMLNALLTAGIDHGPGVASALTARIDRKSVV